MKETVRASDPPHTLDAAAAGRPLPAPSGLWRESLLARVRSRRSPLVLVQAPLGYGKTTFAAQYAASTPQARWYSAEAGWTADHLTEALHSLEGAEAAQGVLIVDDAHRLGGEAHAQLERWILASDRSWQVLLLSRADLSADYVRLVTSGQVCLVGTVDLAFSAEEQAALSAGAAPDDQQLDPAPMCGWPLGLGLLTTPGVDARQSVRTLLASVYPALWTHLPTLSLLRVWDTAQPAIALPGLLPDWLTQLSGQGFPLLRRADGTSEPLPFVRGVLQEALITDPAHAAAVARIVPSAMDDESRTLILRHCARSGLREAALEMAQALINACRARWDFGALVGVIETLPPAWRSDHVLAVYGHALLETGQAARGEVVLRDLNARGYRDAEVLHALSALAGRQGQHGRQLRLAQESLGLFPPTEIAWRLRRDCAYALLNLGDVEAAIDTAQTLVDECEERDALVPLAETLCLMQVAFQKVGRLYEAERCLKRALQLYEALGLTERSLLLLNDLADLKRLQGDVQAGHELVEQAFRLCAGRTSPVLTLLEETCGDLLSTQGELDGARLRYQEAARQCGSHLLEAVSQRLHLKLAEICVLKGELEAADSALRAARGSYAGNAALLHFYEGSLLFHQDRGEQARTHLEQSLALGVGIDRKLRLHAMLAVLSGSHEGAEPHLAALRASREQLNLPMLLLREWFRLEAAGLSDLNVPELPSVRAASVAEGSGLRVSSFGALHVWCADRPVKIPFAKAAELLLYLILHGPTSKERIVDALWDGSAEKRHADYFKVGVRQLRLSLKGATGHGNPLPHEEGRYFLHPGLSVQADFNDLTVALTSGEMAVLAAALGGYVGDFLPSSYAEWACDARARMAENALTVALRLGRHPGASWSQAVAAFERAIEIDPLRDEPYQALIDLYARVDNAEMARKYERAWQKMLD